MWELISPNRWHVPTWTDSDNTVSPRELLLYANGDRFVEVHRDSAFVYAAADVINPDSPLDGAQWRRTVENADLPDGEGDDVWQALVQIAAEPLPDNPGPASA